MVRLQLKQNVGRTPRFHYFFDDEPRCRRMTPGPTSIIECPSCGALHQLATAASDNTFGGILWSDGKLEAPMLFNCPELARCVSCRALFWLKSAKTVGVLPTLPFAPERSWRVTLCDTGANRVNVMAVLRRHLAVDMTQTKQFIANLPVLVAFGAGTSNDGTALMQDLLTAGAVATHDVTIEAQSPTETPIPPAWIAAPLVPPMQELDFLDAVDSCLWSDAQSEVRIRTATLHAGNDPFRQTPADWQPLTDRHSLAMANALVLFDLLSPNIVTENLLRAEIAREQGLFGEALRIASAPSPQERLSHERLAAELVARAERRDSALFSVDLADEQSFT